MKYGRGLSPGALSWDMYNFTTTDSHLGLNIRVGQIPFHSAVTVSPSLLTTSFLLNHDHFLAQMGVPVSCCITCYVCQGRLDGEAELLTAPTPNHQTSGIQGIPLVTPEGLWGVDQLWNIQRLWSEKWQLNLNSQPLRKQSHAVDAWSVSLWLSCSEKWISISKAQLYFNRSSLGNWQLWWQPNIANPELFLHYFKQYHCSVGQGGYFISNMVSDIETQGTQSTWGYPVPSREKQQAQMGVHACFPPKVPPLCGF